MPDEPASPAPEPTVGDTAVASGRLARSAAKLGALTGVSRVLGLARDVVQAALLGAGGAADAFVIAWTLPNLARRIFGEGALTAAFLPVFERVRDRDGQPAALRLATRVLTVLVLGLVLVAGLGVIGALLLRGRLAGWADLPAAKTDLLLGLTAVLLAYMPIVCAIALLVATLNSLGRFAFPALPPIIQNLAWIAGLGAASAWALGEDQTAYASAIAILVGAGAGFALLAVALRRAGMRLRPELDLRDGDVRHVGRLFWPTVFGLAVVQLNILADRFIAEAFVAGDGAVSALYYGHQLMELPMGMIAIAVATVVFPQLARLGAAGDRAGFGLAMARALRLVLAVSIPAAIGLAVTREPVVRMLFERGRFDAVDRTAWVTLYYAIAVAPASLLPVLARGHHAWTDTRTPVRIGASCVGLNIVLNLLLVQVSWLAEAGLAAATAISATVQVAWLAFALRRRADIAWRTEVWRPLARVAVAGLACGVAAWGAMELTRLWGPDTGFAAAALQCGVAIPTGVAAYLAVGSVLGIAEIGQLLRRRLDP